MVPITTSYKVQVTYRPTDFTSDAYTLIAKSYLLAVGGLKLNLSFAPLKIA